MTGSPQKTNLRFSDAPVEIGMIRYVSSPIAGESVAACIVISTEAPVRIFDQEERCYCRSYPYRVRRATEAEEAAYLALPRHSDASNAYRAEG